MKTPIPLAVHANDLARIDAAASATGMSREDVLILGGVRLANELSSGDDVETINQRGSAAAARADR